MEKFQNKYRIPSARLQNWDYGENGAYFITICTKNMVCYFGNVETRLIASVHDDNAKSVMELNELGKIAYRNWENIPHQFPYVELGSFVIMPNHIHGILIINKYASVETRLIASNNNDDENAETRLIASVQSQNENENKKGGFAGDKNPMLNENISRIIRWYKGRCSFEMRKIHADFEWLSRFHDHIIRDSNEFERIQTYIENNPSKWNDDKFNKR
jgi:REP element-mobilizing transposase RayT